MNFLNLPGFAVALGLVALATGLYVLQRLRVRQREVTVVTTLFWREALEENRARVLTQRFRHPWAYLFLLALASLLWLGLAGIMQTKAPTTAHVLLLDGSMGMQREDSFAQAKEQLLEEAASVPAAARTVYWCGARLETLLGPGEELPLLEARLHGRTPESAPSRMEAFLPIVLREQEKQFATDTAPQLTLLVYGQAPTRPEWIGDLPANVELLRRSESVAAKANRGFVAGGIGEAESGLWNRVDLSVSLAMADNRAQNALEGLEVSHGGEAWNAGFESVPSANPDIQVLRFLDVPTNGEDFVLRLSTQDDFPADDQLTLSIPLREALRVQVAPSLQELMLPLLAADPAVLVTEDQPQLLIRQESDPGDSSMPTLLVFMDDGGALFRLRHQDSENADQLLHDAYRELGMASIDALGLATALDRPVSVDASLGTPQLGLAAPLLAADAGFTSSRSFPLLVSRGLRWLVNQLALVPYAAAGQPLPGEAGELFGSARVVGTAGKVTLQDQREVHVASFDTSASLPAAPVAVAAEAFSGSSGAWPMWTWFSLVALLLLLVEWFLFQRGRLP